MDSPVWRDIGGKVNVCFDQIIARVKEINPGLVGQAGWSASLGQLEFSAALTFMRDPGQQEYEDLIVSLFCGAADRAGFWTDDGEPTFPLADGRDAIGVEIARGTGEVLAALTPMLLPPNQDSPEYEQAVRQYARRAVLFIEDQTGLILATLRAI